MKIGISKDKIKEIHNFIDTDLYNLQTIDEDYVLYSGRLVKEKGIFELIKAFTKLDNKKLHIIGDGPERENIEKYIKENHLEEKIKLLGYLSQSDLKEQIRRCTFVVVPSIWYENCPYSILETMAIRKTNCRIKYSWNT